MPESTRFLSEGAGATTGSTPSSTNFIGSSASSRDADLTVSNTNLSQTGRDGSFQQDRHETGYRPTGRAVVVANYNPGRPRNRLVIGAALAGAVIAGAIPFFLTRRSTKNERPESEHFEESVTIDRPAQEIYDFWRDFTNLPQFMDNIKSVENLDARRSFWVIKAPAGTSVQFTSRVVDDIPGRLIAWESEDASVPNRGRVDFESAPSGGGTIVRVTMSYDPPAGAAGKMVAKLFQREPSIQAKEDLARLKSLLEGRLPN
jgi:uncharacterized membrane protein